MWPAASFIHLTDCSFPLPSALWYVCTPLTSAAQYFQRAKMGHFFQLNFIRLWPQYHFLQTVEFKIKGIRKQSVCVCNCQDKEGQLFTSGLFAGCFYLAKCTGNWTQLNFFVLTTLSKVNTKLCGLGKVHWCSKVSHCQFVHCQLSKCQV